MKIDIVKKFLNYIEKKELLKSIRKIKKNAKKEYLEILSTITTNEIKPLKLFELHFDIEKRN